MIELPTSWLEPAISDVAEVNPRKDVDLSPSDLVSFVPMSAVDEVSGTILSPVDRPYAEVSKGFTHFRDDDVIFAKITPSMENGKSAVARSLTNGTGMGSTEFHVFRSYGAIEPEFLWRFVRQKSFRENAQAVMSGAVGQQRVPADYLKDHLIPLPPLPEQRRIVAKVEGLTARTARARKDLDRIPTLIARYKQRLLALAFSGELPALNPARQKAEFCAIGDIVDISSGYGFPKDRQGKTEGDYPFAKVSDISRAVSKNGGALTTAVNYVDQADLKTLKAKPIAAGSIVFAKIGEALKLNRRAITTVPLILDNNCMALTPDSSKVLSAYLLRFMETVDLGPLSVATAVPSVRRGDVASLQILLPSLVEQAEIVRRIESAFGWLHRMAADHAAAARLLPKLDAAILAKAFRGALVPQAPTDELASVLLERVKSEREAEGKKPKSARGRKPNGSKAMTEKPLLPRERLLKDSEKWPAVGLPFEAIAMRNSMPHDALRDALFELLSGPSPALQQRFDTDAEVMVIQRVAA